MRMKALVTGATGYIGSNLINALINSDWVVHVIVRKGSKLGALTKNSAINIHIHDGSSESMISIFGHALPDVTFHLASDVVVEHSSEQVEGLINSNILFSTQLVEAMIRSDCRKLINTGTSWQNYHSTDYRAVNLYAATKQAFECIIDYYHDEYGLSCITLKLFDTYSIGDKRKKLVNLLIDSALNSKEIFLTLGDQEIDISHVAHVVSCFTKAAEDILICDNAVRETYFVRGNRMTVRELVGKVENVLGVNIKSIFGERPYRKREVMKISQFNEDSYYKLTPSDSFEDELKKAFLEGDEAISYR